MSLGKAGPSVTPGAVPATNLRSGAGRQTPKRSESEPSIADIIKKVIVEMALTIEKTINSAVASALETIVQLEASLKAENERLQKTVADLRIKLQSQEFEIDKLAQYSRKENIRINGVPEEDGEETDDVVIGIACEMGVTIDRRDISISHRLSKQRAMRE